MKIHIWDKSIRKTFCVWLSGISTIVSLIAIFFPLSPKCNRWILFWGFLLVLFVLYVSIWGVANIRKKTSFKINSTKVLIKEGDLFQETGKKVIPVNEYFDTHVGDGIIEPRSLHGQYITSHTEFSPKDLQARINNSLKNKRPEEIDMYRENGNQIKYPLGTIYDDNNGFLLLAYSRFDENNRATMNTEDVLACYNKMWDEIDIHRGNDSIALPVMGGSGLVRGTLANYSEQQLIELLLWSFRISGIHLSRSATLTIVVHKSMSKKINMLDLKKYSD